jgi:hypothetical protein
MSESLVIEKESHRYQRIIRVVSWTVFSSTKEPIHENTRKGAKEVL